jgi:hypothetical protein
MRKGEGAVLRRTLRSLRPFGQRAVKPLDFVKRLLLNIAMLRKQRSVLNNSFPTHILF